MFFSREAWGARDPKCSTPWNVAEVLGITIHHFGKPRAVSPASAPAQLRSIQAGHMGPGGLGEKDGGCDIAYSFAVHPNGDIYTLRGWNVQSGANGTTFSNRHYLAFVYMGHSDLDGFPETAQKSLATLLKMAFARGVGREVVPHRKWTGSTCPGDRAHAWVVNGGWKADIAEPKRCQWLLVDDGDVLDRSLVVPLAESRDRMDKFLNPGGIDRALLHRRIAEEGARGTAQLVRRVLS